MTTVAPAGEWRWEQWGRLREGNIVLGPDTRAWEIRHRFGWTFTMLSWDGRTKTVTADPTSAPVMSWYPYPELRDRSLVPRVLPFPMPDELEQATRALIAGFGSVIVDATATDGDTHWRCPAVLTPTELRIHVAYHHGDDPTRYPDAELYSLHAREHAVAVGSTLAHYHG